MLMQEEYICTVTNFNARRIHIHTDIDSCISFSTKGKKCSAIVVSL